MASPTEKSHSRSWSFRSKKEDRLTQFEKNRGKMTKGVDPTRAITEDEPFQVNQGKNHARSLSTLKFKDRFGNEIVEPDLTNPTRHRWERPLDTIRGFEAAIYKDEHRGSYIERNESNAGNSSEMIDAIPDGTWKHTHNPQQSGQYEATTGTYPRGRHQGDVLNYTSRSANTATPRSGFESTGESELGFGNMNRQSPGPNSYGYPPQSSERMGQPQRRPAYDTSGYDSEGPNAGGPSQNYGYTYPSNGSGGGESPITNPGSSSSGAGSDGPNGLGGTREPLPKSNSGQSSFGFRDQAMFESSQQITPFEPFNPPSNAQAVQNLQTSSVQVSRGPIPLNSTASPPPDAKAEKDKRRSWFKRKGNKG